MYKTGTHMILVNSNICDSCISLIPICRELSMRYTDISYHELTQADDINPIVEQYDLRKLPTILLITDNECIGVVNGYQPLEILQLWLESKLERKN